jgi:hypothetical protein
MESNYTSPYLYLRGLRQADHTVFCVQDGQKAYRDPSWGRQMAYSSGQQVKRSVLDGIVEHLQEQRAPITFNKVLKNRTTLEDGEPWSPCDPTYADQLLGGWMRAQKGGSTIKRRSPLSISAMRPLHPLLSNMASENATFDRSDQPDLHPVRVTDAEGNDVSPEALRQFLEGSERSLSRRNWIPDLKRTSGLFVYDIAIDLRRLFRVSLTEHDPELSRDMIEKLRGAGWRTTSDGRSMVAPQAQREKIIPALAYGLIHWRVTSNQSRTFSPQATLALAVSDSANKIAGAIRADLVETESNREQAEPVIELFDGVQVFTALPAKGYIKGVVAASDALEQARKHVEECLNNFSYEA